MYRRTVPSICFRSNGVVERSAHIGHGAIIHGATIGKNCLIGMNSVIMDDVVLEDECIVGALTMIKANERFPARSLIVGNPGKLIKEVSDEMISWKNRRHSALPGIARRDARKLGSSGAAARDPGRQAFAGNFIQDLE